MKKLFYFLSIVLLTMFASCNNEFDDSKLQDRLDKLEEEQKQLEEEHKQMQEQIDAQQTLLDALTKNLTIVSIVETDEEYVVTFSDNSTMIVGHGNSYIENIEVGEEAIIFTLADGTEVVLPLNSGGNSGGEVVGENNKIYYTTSDGKKLFPSDSGAATFGAILISNTYKDGQGVLTFDDSITLIGSSAFRGCSSLTSVTIPDSVTTIGNSAFYDCSSLTSVTIPDSVTTIGEDAFYNCSSLTSVTIPDSVTSIGYAAFSGCSSLMEFNGKFASEDGRCLIVDGVLNSFAPSRLTEYTIPNSVTSIGHLAFEQCSSLTSVTIPDSVTTIADFAFSQCWSLTSVYCKAIIPPVGDRDMFINTSYGFNIYVPMESVEAYKSAEGWSRYDWYIVGYDF